MLKIVSCSLLFIILTGCKNEIILPYYNTPDFTPIFIDDESQANKIISHSISDFEFESYKDIKVSKSTLKNKVHIASFIFTQCGSICPIMIENLKVLEKYKEYFPKIILGLSDHTHGHSTVLGSVALGARVIEKHFTDNNNSCLLYTSPSPRDRTRSRMPSSA